MALVLIFICSLIGIFMAAVQIVVLGNGAWLAIATYLTFAIAYPICFFLLFWSLDRLRAYFTVPQRQDPSEQSGSSVRHQAAGF